VLSGLLEQIEVSNNELKAAEARYRAARSQVSIARSALFPTLGVSASAERVKRADAPAVTAGAVTLDAGWEIDLWGRIRRTIEAAEAGREASASDLEAARLLLQAEAATNYFQLRVTDVAKELLEDAVKNYERNYQLTQNRYAGGVAAKRRWCRPRPSCAARRPRRSTSAPRARRWKTRSRSSSARHRRVSPSRRFHST
jgi:outer membrane protein TolC